MYALEQDIIGAWEEPLLYLNPLIQIVWRCLIKAHSTTAGVGGGDKRGNWSCEGLVEIAPRVENRNKSSRASILQALRLTPKLCEASRNFPRATSIPFSSADTTNLKFTVCPMQLGLPRETNSLGTEPTLTLCVTSFPLIKVPKQCRITE